MDGAGADVEGGAASAVRGGVAVVGFEAGGIGGAVVDL